MTTTTKPKVYHAGCGGEVALVKSFGGATKMFCGRCGSVITDPMELTPRGSGHQKEPDAAPEWDRVSL